MAQITNVVGIEVRRALKNIEELHHLSEEAQKRALSAEEMARLSELLSKNTQAQLNQAILDGDPLEETQQARHNSVTGETAKLLYERLDKDYADTNTKIISTKSDLGNKNDLPAEGDNLTAKTVNEFDDRGYNIRWGALMAVQDGGDWTRAIQTIYNTLEPGGKLFVPRGRWLVSNLVFDRSHIHLDIRGVFIQKEDATGVCIQIGTTSGYTQNVKTEGILKVERDEVDWSIDSTGVRLLNLYESEMTLNIKRFQRGLLLEATLGYGTVYNNINLLRITDNKISIDFKTEEIDADNRGWVNENKFFGGRFDWDRYFVDRLPGESREEAFKRLGCIHINMPSKYMNNNIFFSPSLEGRAGKFIYCNGNFNTFYSPRLEGQAIKVHWGIDSIYNQVLFPFFTDYSSETYEDEGTRNKIFGRDYIRMDRTAVHASYFEGDGSNVPSDQHGIFDAYTRMSSSRKAFRVRNSQNEETFSVIGDGTVKAHMYRFNSGGFISPDGSLTERHFALVTDWYQRESVKIAAIKNTPGPPLTSNQQPGSAVLNTADNKLYFHFGGGVWKGTTLS